MIEGPLIFVKILHGRLGMKKQKQKQKQTNKQKTKKPRIFEFPTSILRTYVMLKKDITKSIGLFKTR